MLRMSRRLPGIGPFGLLFLLTCAGATLTSDSARAEPATRPVPEVSSRHDPVTSPSLAWQTTPNVTPGPASPAPDIGPAIVADSTLATFPSFTCPTGRNKQEPVGEGYIFKVTGPCYEGAPVALALLKITDIVFRDGEVRFELKVVTGQERASFIVGFREQRPGIESSADNYQAILLPGLGWATLFRGESALVVRKDLGSALSRDDWNTVAVRASGPNMWLLVNDQLVAQATDSAYDQGFFFFALRRTGELNDSAETAAVIRNIRISRLASGDPARAPAIQKS
jgi:hypothetical protein